MKVLQDAQSKFPGDTTIGFELGAVFDKQKKFADAEAAFRQVLNKEPDNAPALNYIGYMLAERGERLDRVGRSAEEGARARARQRLVSRQPRLGVLQGRQAAARARQPAARGRSAEDQLGHPGSLRRRALQALALRRSDRRVEQALGGDNDTIDRPAIDKKIKTAKQKLGKK